MTPTQPTSRARPRGGKPNGFSRTSLIDQLVMVNDDLEDILVKQPRDLTEAEVRRIAERRLALPAGDEKDALYALEQAFFEDVYGSEQATTDGTGRLTAPAPKRPVNAAPVPARSADGMELSRAVTRLAERVADIAETQGSRDAVRFLQQGLTILNQARTAAGPVASRNRPPADGPLFQDLVDDGLPGPKTRTALRRATARLGAPKVEEALALGRFEEALKSLPRGGLPDGIRGAAAEAFAALFRDPDRDMHTGATEEGESLQMAINDIGPALLGGKDFTTLREDGVIGPKTEAALKRVLAAAGPRRMTEAMGKNLGFFQFEVPAPGRGSLLHPSALGRAEGLQR